MKFIFKGDPRDHYSGPDFVRVFGYLIGRFEPVEVDERTAQKLTSNTHFEAVHGDVIRDQAESGETVGDTANRPDAKRSNKRRSHKRI